MPIVLRRSIAGMSHLPCLAENEWVSFRLDFRRTLAEPSAVHENSMLVSSPKTEKRRLASQSLLMDEKQNARPLVRVLRAFGDLS